MFGMHGDVVTPPKHILAFAKALDEHNIPFEIHMFKGPGHGLSLGTEVTRGDRPEMVNIRYANWFKLSVSWLKEVFKIV